ncbi:helix-turn-helix domain-containing protein [Celeribacter sp.]|uniref:helix-turn-helix domain-containing protein n=1 Tax=Celeribacter sp. TaxID=1890673 RepID=UPI003A95C286
MTREKSPRREAGIPKHERQFYARDRAFGRFGIRTFAPTTMDIPHWHGHVELNFCVDGELVYDFDGSRIKVPENTFAMFWAGVPHQLLDVREKPGRAPRLCNIYLPSDMFLMMPHIARLQVALLAGGVISAPKDLCDHRRMQGWYEDYRTGDVERIEVVKMELNALFRRILLDELTPLHAPDRVDDPNERALYSAHIRHVVEMVRFILENLEKPIRNADVTAVTGLHENYAITLFSRVMRTPIKKFVVRLRLIRARGLLIESTLPIARVAEVSGFSSTSQFYAHFKTAYGMPPNAVREHYINMELR